VRGGVSNCDDGSDWWCLWQGLAVLPRHDDDVEVSEFSFCYFD